MPSTYSLSEAPSQVAVRCVQMLAVRRAVPRVSISLEVKMWVLGRSESAFA